MDGIKIVKDIASRLGDSKFVNNVLVEKDNYLDLGNIKFYPDIPLSLSHGLPGLCLLYSELDKLYPNEGYHEVCNSYIKQIVSLIEEDGIYASSLFSGSAGLAFSIKTSSHNGKYYNSLLNTINNYLYEQLDENIEYLYNKKDTEMFDYDLIEGACGVGSYLLTLDDAKSKSYLKKILEYLIKLSEPIDNCSNLYIPKYYIKKDYLFSDEEKNYYNNGIINLGMSHGIPAPLILLCNAYKKNIISDNQKNSIDSLVKVILNSKIQNCNDWNGMIGLDEYINGAKDAKSVRDAWCYGTPGVSYSLLTASKVLNNNDIYNLSCKTMKESAKNAKGLFSPTFCHGYSGLAYLCYKFYYQTKDNDFLRESEKLLEKILSYYDNNLPFGFCNIELSNSKKKKINSIALLDGVSGVLLTLLELIKKTNNVDWDVAFLLNN